MAKPGAKPNVAAGSDPPAAERSVHHRPDDHETEAVHHDDDVIDHDRPVNDRDEALRVASASQSHLSAALPRPVDHGLSTPAAIPHFQERIRSCAGCPGRSSGRSSPPGIAGSRVRYRDGEATLLRLRADAGRTVHSKGGCGT